MKYIYTILTFFCLHFSAKAQINSDKATTSSDTAEANSFTRGMAKGWAPLTLRDKLPAAFWTANRSILTKEANLQHQLQQFKGKALVLDFWATWCSACLKQFPKMNQLQAQLGKNLQILLVNSYSKDSLALLQSFLQKQDPSFRLPILAYDPAMEKLFPVNSLPHYIWIGADGRIKAITTADALTVANLQRLIAGLELNLALKTN